MNADVKAAWVAALRSGEYEQGHYVLHSTDDRFCCLGVLCQLGVEAGVIRPGVSDGDKYAYGTDSSTSALPFEVMAWSGIDSPWGDLPLEVERSRRLSTLNDNHLPFDDIADVIEEQL